MSPFDYSDYSDFKGKFDILKHYQREIQRCSDQGLCLTVDDISHIFSFPILSESNILCVANIKNKLVPSLSLGYLDREVYYYNNINSLKDHISKSRDVNKNSLNTSDNFMLEYSHKTVNYVVSASFPFDSNLSDSDKQEICSLIGNICDIVLESSLHIKNIERDNTIDKYNDLNTLLRSNDNFSLYDLSCFIMERENYSLLPIDVHSLFDMQFSEDIIESNRHRLSLSILDYNSIIFKNRVRYQLVETTRTGKVFSGCVVDDGFNCHYAFIPVIRKKETPIHITRVLLIYKNLPFYLKEIDNIIEYVDLYVSYGMIYRKLNMSISSQQDILNMSGCNHSITINNYQDFYAEFKKFLSPRLTEILNTTYASTASVRIYEPKDNTLVLLENVSRNINEIDAIKLINNDKPIKLKNYRTNAIAFTYLDGNTNFEYLYINNCNSSIPSEYKSYGLDSDLQVDKNIKSKICFPLLSNQAPFGVITIGSKVKKAFDDIDINYTRTLKKTIEAYYNNLLHLNDIQWIRSQINNYENIHELKNLVDTNIFNAKSRSLLRRYLFLNASEKTITVKKNLSSLEREIKIWISQMYCNLTNENQRKIASIVIYQFEEKNLSDTLSNDFIDSILVILKNLILNVVRYGDIDQDRIAISNKPFFNFGDSREIRIYMKSYGSVGPDLVKLGIVPIFDSSNKPHFGMFLVGMLTRILGGIINVSKEELSAYHIIEIRIPLLSHGGKSEQVICSHNGTN